MHKLSLKDIKIATGGEIISGDENIYIESISTDSRELKVNGLFVPIIGENCDAHNFINSAYKNGCVATLSQKEISADGIAVILVDDTKLALGRLSKYYKELFTLKTVAITGSVGKTTTKDMLHSVMSTQYNTLKTEGNYNNEIGLPLTALRLKPSHEAAVFEMGMSSFGEISYLAKIVQPEVALITNIGMSHIENLGSQEGIYKAKMEICDYFDKNNLLIVNGDDKFLKQAKGIKKFNVVTYGIENKECDYLAYDIENLGLLGTRFKTKIYDKEYQISIKTPGVHNIYNALGAIACGVYYNISPQRIIDGIENFTLTKMRMSVEEANGITIINDCYNSSPDSVKAALGVLATENKRRVAILGDILEMGEFGKDAHYNIGKDVFEKGMDLLLSVGKNAKFIAEGAKEAGMDPEKIIHFEKTEDLEKCVKNYILPNDSVLVKASRGMAFEKIVEALKS